MRIIVSADLHLRDTLPRCRKDENWMQFQIDCLKQISDAANQYQCDVAICGDIFHKSVVSEKLKNIFIDFVKNVNKKAYVLYGQHDMLYRNIDNISKTSLGVIINSSIIQYLCHIGKMANYGLNPIFTPETMDPKLLFLHTLIFKDRESMPPNVNAVTAEEILKRYPEAEWVFAGDQHHGFYYKNSKKRHVLVPGCLNRQAADMKDYNPCIWFIDTEEEIVENIPIRDDVEIVDDSYIRKIEEKNERIDSFVESVSMSEKISLDYVKNVEETINNNPKIKEGVKVWIQRLIAEGTK